MSEIALIKASLNIKQFYRDRKKGGRNKG